MKLKTLKDFYMTNKGINMREVSPNTREIILPMMGMVNGIKLREEAIKWAKLGFMNLQKYKGDEKYEYMEAGVRQFIIKFFNITEEDLKNG